MGIRSDPAIPTADSSPPGEEQLQVLKHCTKCQELKPLSEFYANKSAPDGLRHTCKACEVASRTPTPLARSRAWVVYSSIKRCKNPTAPRNRSKTNPEGLSIIDLLERWLSQ